MLDVWMCQSEHSSSYWTQHGVFSLLLSSHGGRVWGFFSGICIFVTAVAFLLGGITPCHHAKSIWVTFKSLWKPEQQNEVKMEKRSSRKECLTCDVWAQLILFSTLCLFESLFSFYKCPFSQKTPLSCGFKDELMMIKRMNHVFIRRRA